MTAFKPVIEPESPSAFLTAHPLSSVSEQSTETPLLFGINHDDGAMKSARKQILSQILPQIDHMNGYWFCLFEFSSRTQYTWII